MHLSLGVVLDVSAQPVGYYCDEDDCIRGVFYGQFPSQLDGLVLLPDNTS
jgi:hypothetical protein